MKKYFAEFYVEFENNKKVIDSLNDENVRLEEERKKLEDEKKQLQEEIAKLTEMRN